MGMGGPLNRAALTTLEPLLDHGLYLGPRRGDVLCMRFDKFAQIQRLENAFRLRSWTKKSPAMRSVSK